MAHHQPRYQPHTVTYLGDDLYANQPLCQLIDQTYAQFFVFVCKPDSHITLYEWLASLAGANGLETRQARHWNGKHGEIWSYRLGNQSRSGKPAFVEGLDQGNFVNYCAARGVDKPAIGLDSGQAAGVDHVPCVRSEGDMQGQKVRFMKKQLQGIFEDRRA